MPRFINGTEDYWGGKGADLISIIVWQRDLFVDGEGLSKRKFVVNSQEVVYSILLFRSLAGKEACHFNFDLTGKDGVDWLN
jgi:hypothetical protein